MKYCNSSSSVSIEPVWSILLNLYRLGTVQITEPPRSSMLALRSLTDDGQLLITNEIAALGQLRKIFSSSE